MIKDPEKRKEYHRNYYRKKKAKRQAQAKAQREKDPTKTRAQTAARQEKHREKSARQEYQCSKARFHWINKLKGGPGRPDLLKDVPADIIEEERIRAENYLSSAPIVTKNK